MLGQLINTLEKLGWEYGDEVDVEIGGTQSLVLMWVKSTTRSGSHPLVLVSTTKTMLHHHQESKSSGLK